MKTLPYMIFSFLMLCALCTSINSYRRTENIIAQDVNRALEQVLVKMPDNVVTTDTIRCYRNCLTIAELKDTAGIAMRTVRKDGRWETQLVAEANCGFATTFMMSDQKASGSFLFAGLLWLLCSLWYIKRKRPELIAQGISYGGIVFYNDKFMTLSGEQIRLTPMQHSLHRNVHNKRHAYSIKTAHLRPTMAEEARCKRHALHADKAHKANHRDS